MTAPTRTVSINLFQVIGTALPNARVVFNLTRAIILADDSGLVPIGSTVAQCDPSGIGSAALVPNALGKTPTQYTVEVWDEQGNKVFPAKGVARMYLQDQDCLLHAALFSIPPMSQSDADAAVLDARTSATASQASAVASEASRQAADADVIQTGADRVQTGLDRSATGLSVTQAGAFMLSAAAQASQAALSATAALSVAQQDLSGVSAQALHRSPNAIVGTAFYNVINDSNPAWPDRCDDRSWMTEALNGNWLTSGSVGGLQSELAARATNATLGAEVNVAGDLTGWTPNANASITGGKLTINTTIVGGGAVVATAPTGVLPAGLYRISMTVDVAPLGGGGVSANIFTSPMLPAASAGTFVDVVSVTGGGGSLNLIVRGANALAGTVVSKISVRPISAFNTKSGDYYQLATDGKFYRLSAKNLLLNNSMSGGVSGVYGAGAAAPTSWTAPFATGQITFSPSARDAGAQQVRFVGGATDRPYFSQQINAAAGVTYTLSCYVEAIISGALRMDAVLTTSPVPAGAVVSYRKNGGAATLATAIAAGDFLEVIISGSTAAGVIQVRWGLGASTGTAGDVTLSVPQIEMSFGGATATTPCEVTTPASYGETFRGNTAKFPRRTLWVAEATRVVGYDLTQPGNPMWMVFAGGSEFVLRASNCTSLSLREGVLYVGQQGALGTLARVNFATDVCDFYHTAGLFKRSLPTVANRNATATVWAAAGTTGISHNTINCVATATLADAPVDPATGLQAPTVAMGTASAVSLVKHDGSVIVSIGTGSFTSIVLNEFILMYGTTGDNAVRYVLSPGTALTGFTPLLTTPSDFSGTAASGLTKALAMSRRGDMARAVTAGARLNLMRFNDMAAANGLAAAITDTFNTGWMIGDIRRTLLCDTVAGVVSGAELSSGAWYVPVSYLNTISAASPSGFSASLSGTTQSRAAEALVTVPNQDYAITVTSNISTVNLFVRDQGDVGTVLNTFTPSAGVPTTYTFRATSTATYLVFAENAGAAFTISGLSVKAAAMDRSNKAKASTVVGTLTKAVVATGAQLMTYSGFGAANYVREAYSADLDFGTTGFCARVKGFSLPAMSIIGPGFQNTLPASSFNAVGAPLAIAMNTANWTKGTGWSAPTASTFSSDGTQVAQSDLQWITGSSLTAGGFFRKWTVTVTAVTGAGLTVFPNSSSPVGITAPGTYTLFGDGNASTLLRVAAGVTVSGSLVVEDVAPAMIFSRSAATGAKFELGVSPFGVPIGIVSDGTTTRTVSQGTVNSGGVSLAGMSNISAELSLSPTGTVTLRVNALQVTQAVGTPLLTMSNAAAVLTIGQNFGLTAPFPGSISIIDITATLPSDDARAWVYLQEKPMFQPGAQVTLPDVGPILAVTYDERLDEVLVATAVNSSSFRGLTRVASAPVSAGALSKIDANAGFKAVARTTTNPGVDITYPAQNLKEELLRSAAEPARMLVRPALALEWVGGFTGTLALGLNTITSISGMSLPPGATAVGAQVSHANLPAGTTILELVGTTAYLSANATAAAAGAAIAFLDFLPATGVEVRSPYVNGTRKVEGATKDYTKLFDGFRERIRFPVASPPGATAAVSMDAYMRRAA